MQWRVLVLSPQACSRYSGFRTLAYYFCLPLLSFSAFQRLHALLKFVVLFHQLVHELHQSLMLLLQLLEPTLVVGQVVLVDVDQRTLAEVGNFWVDETTTLACTPIGVPTLPSHFPPL